MAQKRKSAYSGHDGFAVSDNENGAVPQAKRSKKSGETSSSHVTTPSMKAQTDSNGDRYWEISKARRVTINDFKGKKMVAVREYYEKDGDWLPGKKGISMTIDQYSALLTLLPSIEAELRQTGVTGIPRPNYNAIDDTNGPSKDAEEEGETLQSEDDRRGGGRANHEATSDEEA